jgi:hypothetical protein
MRPKLAIALVTLLSLCGSSFAATYEVSVTRKAQNLYRVGGKNVLIQTRYCYVYAYSEESIFKWDGYDGKIIFIQSKESCDVKGAYGASNQKAGKYSVTVSRQDADWYEVFGTSTFIKTSSCLSLALGEEAFLSLSAGGYGQLIFKDGDSCMVEGVFTKLRL